MSDFTVDTASLAGFRAAVDRAQGRVDGLRGLADAARLAPGTFTRTAGGQVADTGHAEMLDGIGAQLDSATEKLRAIAEATSKTMDNYASADARHGAAMSEIKGQLDTAGGYEA
ncbi:MAG: hypothetical protein GEV03_04390 [Streptosporangiales bacterium]|nr:hypothetical protein [Streptosporangiales bacterium]